MTMERVFDPSWELSPAKPGRLHDKDLINTSPTRVLDFEDVWEEEEEKSQENVKIPDKKPADADSIFRRLASPDLTIPPPPPYEYKPKPSRRKVGTLPTLKETASASFEDADEPGGSLLRPSGSPKSFLLKKGSKQTSRGATPSVKRSPVASRKLRPKTHFEKLEKLMKRAEDFTDEGREEEAIKVYRKALSGNASELSKIKVQLAEADTKHPSTVESIQLRLREDWLAILMSTGKIRTNLAIIHERMGRYKEAISCCEEALFTYVRQPDLKGLSFDEANMAKLVESTNERLEKLKLGESSFEERKQKHQEIARLRTEAAASGDKEALRKAEVLCMEVKGIETASLGVDHPQIASTCTDLSEIASGLGDPDRAISYSGEALRINELVLGDRHICTGDSLVHLARLYAQNSDDDDAVQTFTRALEFYRSREASPLTVASLLHEVALIAMRNEQYEVAIRCLNDALDLHDARDGSKPRGEEKDVDVISNMAVLWCGLGRCCLQIGRFEESVVAMANMLDLQRDLRQFHEAAAADRAGDAKDVAYPELATEDSIAGTLRRLARALGCSKKHAEARAVWKEAILISKIAVARLAASSKGRMEPLLPVKEDELAGDLFNYGKSCFDDGDYSQASAFYEESLQLRLFSDAHKPQGERTNMLHCAMCLVEMGNVHVVKGELSDSQKVYENAMGYCEAAPDIPEKLSIREFISGKIKQVESILSIEVGDVDNESDPFGCRLAL